MKETPGISKIGEQTIQDFIQALAIQDELNPKTLKQYASDLKHFIGWYETVSQQKHIQFQMQEVATPTLTRYRETAHIGMALKPATVNRRLITLKRFFEWATADSRIGRDPAKAVKLIAEEKVRPPQMTDKEEAALLAAAQEDGSLRDWTILTVMIHTGLRTMEICDLAPGDIVIGKDWGQLTVRAGNRNKRREVPLNALCRAALENYMAALPPSAPYLFPSEKTGHRLTERALRHLFHKYMRIARLEGWSAHDLRHRFGYVMASYTPLQRLAQIMGHDRLDTTMVYVKDTPAGPGQQRVAEQIVRQ